MATVKRQKKQETEAWLDTSNPLTGVKSYAERMRQHALMAQESPGNVTPHKAAPIEFTDFELQAKLDHSAVFQEGSVRTDAIKAGGSQARFNQRNQLHTALRALPSATINRHSKQGWLAYQRMHESIRASAHALKYLGGETVTLPPLLPSDATAIFS